MEEALHVIAYWVALLADAIAIFCVAAGVVETLLRGIPIAVRGDATGAQRRALFLRFARWLVAALTFQLGADIVGTSFSATWQEIGQLGAIAVIRTFLSYFLDREVDGTRELQYQREREKAEAAEHAPGN